MGRVVLTYRDIKLELVNDDCLNYLKKLQENTIDCIVTDPPAGIGFMGKEWDTFNKKEWGRKGEEGQNDLKVKKNFEILPRYQNYNRDNFITWLQEIAKECLRVLKPGGHALVWALPRTSHWTATAWENAGFEVRDRIIHCFSTGFPKNLNIGKAVDKLLGNKREVIGEKLTHDIRGNALMEATCPEYKKEINKMVYQYTKGFSEWEGWGTALKPAVEDWWLLRKPLEKGLSVAENILKWKTGGINIDECRIRNTKKDVNSKHYGRFPSHLIIDDSEEVKSLFPNKTYRFFYCAKASREERDMGLEEVKTKIGGVLKFREDGSLDGKIPIVRNNHPTVKPVKLMEYLVKLVCPPGGTVLDPFMGSGTTGIACVNLDKNFIGIEINKDYFEIAEKRIRFAIEKRKEKLF